MSDFSRPPPDAETMVSLKVDNLSFRTRKEDLLEEFSRFGEVGDVYIPRDRFTKESRGFAFIRFFERRDAEDAMDEMDGKVFDDRELRVQKAKYGRPSRPPPNRGRYGGGGGGGGSRSYGGGGGRGSDGGYGRRRRSRSRSRSPRRRRSYSKSPKRHSQSRSRSKSPARRSPAADRSRSKSRSPQAQRNRSPARSRTPEND